MLSFPNKHRCIFSSSSRSNATNATHRPTISQRHPTDFHCGTRTTTAVQHRPSAVARSLAQSPSPTGANRNCTVHRVHCAIPTFTLIHSNTHNHRSNNNNRTSIDHLLKHGLVSPRRPYAYNQQQPLRNTPSSPLSPSLVSFRMIPNINGPIGLQRSASSLSNSNAAGGTTDYQPRFASRLSSTRLPTVAPPAGSHDQILGNNAAIDPIAPPSSLGVVGQAPSATAVLARSASSANAQPQQFVTMTQTTTTTFCYVPASGSLAYNTLPGANRSAAVPHH